MKMRMRRTVLAIFCLLALVLAGCSKEKSSSASESSSDIGNKKVALICAFEGGGINDRGFFQGAWEGISRFGEETDMGCAYYEPKEGSVDSFLETVDLAIYNGAEIVVLAGADFIELAPAAFAAYPDMLFLCNEIPVIEPADNSVIYSFEAEESGFLAGVAAVYEGYTHLGTIMPKQILPVMRLGYGFVQGANWAAGELGIDDIEVKYWYSNSFVPSPDVQAFAAAWYESGTEIIFSSNASVWAAAESAGKYCIGSDTDQSIHSESIITSALKLMSSSTYYGLLQWQDGNFPVDQKIFLSATDGATGLANARTVKYTDDIYQKHLKMIIDDENGIKSGILTGADAATPEDCWNLLGEHNIDFVYVN